jgi:hypothetical protein
MSDNVAFVSETYTNGAWTSTFNHTKSIRSTVEHLTVSEFQVLIELAASALRTMNTSATSIQCDDAIAAAIARANLTYTAEKNQYEEKLESLKKISTVEKETAQSKFDRELQILRNRLEEAEGAAERLKSKCAEVEANSESIRKQCIDSIIKEKDTEFQREAERANSTYNAEKKHYQEKLESLVKITTVEKETVQSKFERELKILRNRLEEAEAAEERAKSKCADIEANSESIRKQCIDSIVKEKDIQFQREAERFEKSTATRISDLLQQHNTAMADLKNLYAEKESRLLKDIEKTLVSSEKGKLGEKEFDDLVLEFMPSWGKLVNTSKAVHATDRSCVIRNCFTLFEVKNYTTPVPKDEVVKFIRDMEDHGDAALGVFISLHTPIRGKNTTSNYISIEWTTKSQMLIYINSFNSNSTKDIFNFIDAYVDTAYRIYTKARETDNSDDSLRLQEQLAHIKVIVQSECKRFEEMSKSMSNDKKLLIEAITKQYNHNDTQIAGARKNLKRIIDIMLGKVDDEEDVIDAVVLTEKKPRAPRVKKSSQI